jgi:hypothetical protein
MVARCGGAVAKQPRMLRVANIRRIIARKMKMRMRVRGDLTDKPLSNRSKRRT